MSGKWVQIHDADWKVPYLGGWCEGYVAMAWGYGEFFKKNGVVAGTEPNGKGKASYASATAQWKANKGNHTGEPPKGITVPVFFSLGNVPNGHIAIRLDDLYVASSTQAGYHPEGYLHKNLADLIATYGKYNGGCKYLGWSEYVDGVQVVKWVEDKPAPKPPVVVKPTPPPVVSPPEPTVDPSPAPTPVTEPPVQSEPTPTPVTPVANKPNLLQLILQFVLKLLKGVKL